MNLSFVILTLNSECYLERCLAGIEHAMMNSGLTYEVLVLENGSRDGTPTLLAHLAANSPGIIVPFFEPANIGTTRSRNRLFAEARGRFLCVMDSDVELRESAIETLLQIMEQDSRYGIVVPRILYPSGAWQKSFDQFPTLIDKINRFFRLKTIEGREASQQGKVTKPFFVEYAISAFWLMRTELLHTVGYLDERIFYSPEDVDYCLRVWKAGYQILYVPSVSIIHHAQEISRGLKISMAKLSHMRGLIYYFIKHRYLLRRPTIAGHPAGARSKAIG